MLVGRSAPDVPGGALVLKGLIHANKEYRTQNIES
jgi:hypothetical protein